MDVETPNAGGPTRPGPTEAPLTQPQVARISNLVDALTGIRDNAGDLPVTIVMGQLKGALVDVRSITHVQLGTPKGHPEQIVLLFAAKA